MLLAYILAPFRRKPGEPLATDHSHYLESVLMANAWLEQGFAVDVIDFRNREFIPRRRYSYFVSARKYLEIIAPRLNRDCVTIAHLDTSHYAFNNHAAYARLLALQARRGITLPDSIRVIEHNRAVEVADFGVVLGNEVTMDTYRYARIPLFSLPVPAVVTFDRRPGKGFASVRRRFLFVSSGSLVHKGLDLVLEAFAGMPEVELTVCGPLEREGDFCREYRRELYETANIHTVGWVDVGSERFRDIVAGCVAVVHPSCAEGQAGAVVNCMAGGVIPIVTRETGISVEGFGVTLRAVSVESIRQAVRELATSEEGSLEERSDRTWRYATEYHTPSRYAAEYADIVRRIRAACESGSRADPRSALGHERASVRSG